MIQLEEYITKERKRQDFIIENQEIEINEEKRKTEIAEKAGLLLE